jgi:hypothetical protein
VVGGGFGSPRVALTGNFLPVHLRRRDRWKSSYRIDSYHGRGEGSGGREWRGWCR